MARSEAACLMHVRVVTVASEARVSVRGASGETECREVFGPVPCDTRDYADELQWCSCKLRESALRRSLRATDSHHGGRLATYLTSLPNNSTQKIEHQQRADEVPRTCYEVHHEDPKILSSLVNGAPSMYRTSGHTVPSTLERTTGCWKYAWGNFCSRHFVAKVSAASTLAPSSSSMDSGTNGISVTTRSHPVGNPSLWLGQQCRLQLPSTPRHVRSLH